MTSELIQNLIYLIFLIILIFVVIKNVNTFKNRFIILTAISNYLVDFFSKTYNEDGDLVLNGTYDGDGNFTQNEGDTPLDDSGIEYLYDSLEPYNKTLFRIWDWGCKNIVPKEVYEKIEEFISK